MGVGGCAGVCKLICPLLFVRDMGERYRREMLAHGGAKEPLLMVEGNWDSVSSRQTDWELSQITTHPHLPNVELSV